MTGVHEIKRVGGFSCIDHAIAVRNGVPASFNYGSKTLGKQNRQNFVYELSRSNGFLLYSLQNTQAHY
jgi:hypothetical protein